MSKLLIFDLWGNYAHFKKPYTTTSPLTYSIPSRTVLTGIIGAILGIKKNKNNIELNYNKCNLSLKIINPIKKVIINQNLIKTPQTGKKFNEIGQKGGRKQIRIENLKDVKYRVYIEIFNKDLYEKLKEHLINHISLYSISFGISEHLANFIYKNEYSYSTEKGDINIDSVVNIDKINKDNIEFEEGKEYFTDTFPLEMKEDREVIKYGEILFERTGQKIKLKNVEYIKINNNENIIWY